MLEAARRHAPHCAFTIRVTHALGMLEGHYTEDTVFPRTTIGGTGRVRGS